MSAHVLLNLLTSWGKEIKLEACQAFYLFYATSGPSALSQALYHWATALPPHMSQWDGSFEHQKTYVKIDG